MDHNWDQAHKTSMAYTSDGCNALDVFLNADDVSINQTGLVYTIVVCSDSGERYHIWDATLGQYVGYVLGVHNDAVHSIQTNAYGNFILSHAFEWNGISAWTHCIDYTTATGIFGAPRKAGQHNAVHEWDTIFQTSDGSAHSSCCDTQKDIAILYTTHDNDLIIMSNCSSAGTPELNQVSVYYNKPRKCSHDVLHDKFIHRVMDSGSVCSVATGIDSSVCMYFYVWDLESAADGKVRAKHVYSKSQNGLFPHNCLPHEHYYIRRMHAVSSTTGMWVWCNIDKHEEDDTINAVCPTKNALMFIATNWMRAYTKRMPSGDSVAIMARCVDGERIIANGIQHECPYQSTHHTSTLQW